MCDSRFPAPAKLNLFLHVVGRRADGYHLLESVFQLLDFGDTLDIRVRADGALRRTLDLPGIALADDLVMRAAQLLKQHGGSRLGADIAVTKRIPIGGGLGGGSSDAATALLALNRLWQLDLPRVELARLGLALGADVPFFIFGRNAFARGIGEELVGIDLPARWYAVIAPGCSVPTAQVFAAADLTRNSKSVKIEDFPAGAWSFPGSLFRNDLEPVVGRQFAAVGQALGWLRGFDPGAVVTARMSGSGACVFAGFALRDQAQAVVDGLPADWRGFVAAGLGVHPLMAYARD